MEVECVPSPMDIDPPYNKSTTSFNVGVYDNSILVFDWDDTLCPSTWLYAVGLLTEDGKKNIELHGYQEILKGLESIICQLLRNACRFGPVFIITAAKIKWVLSTCKLFLPRVESVITELNIHVISAREFYQRHFGVEGTPALWKDETFINVCSNIFSAINENSTPKPAFSNFPKSLISIGDSNFELNACRTTVMKAPILHSKTLKFIENPTIDELSQQLQQTIRIFEEVCRYSGHIELRVVRLGVNQLKWDDETTTR